MRSLKQDLLFLIAVRDCYNLKLLLNPDKFRCKFLRVLTIITKSYDGSREWWINGKRHRVGFSHAKTPQDGPAVSWAHDTQEWWINGNLHRVGFSHAKTPQDGPAVIYVNGSHEWWINGKRVEPFQKNYSLESSDISGGGSGTGIQ